MSTGLASLRASASSDATIREKSGVDPLAHSASVGPELVLNTDVDLIINVIRFLSINDREINTLLDRCSYVVIFFDNDLKRELAQIRSVWRSQDPARSEKAETRNASKRKSDDISADDEKDPEEKKDAPTAQPAAKTPAPPAERQPHPHGSQRSIVFAYICEQLIKYAPADTETHRLIAPFSAMTPKNLDNNIFRLKPQKHETYANDHRNCEFRFLDIAAHSRAGSQSGLQRQVEDVLADYARWTNRQEASSGFTGAQEEIPIAAT